MNDEWHCHRSLHRLRRFSSWPSPQTISTAQGPEHVLLAWYSTSPPTTHHESGIRVARHNAPKPNHPCQPSSLLLEAWPDPSSLQIANPAQLRGRVPRPPVSASPHRPVVRVWPAAAAGPAARIMSSSFEKSVKGATKIKVRLPRCLFL